MLMPRIEIIFTSVEADKVPDAMKQLCLACQDTLSQSNYPPLFAIAYLILDFLSIHPQETLHANGFNY